LKNKLPTPIILLKKLGLLGLPFIIALVFFAFTDPFKVLYSYTNYESEAVYLNRDFVSTETYLNNRKRLRYDGYIFGSSTSLAFTTSDWASYITCKSLFHFDASAESLFGIHGKISLIHKNNDELKCALIVLDRQTLLKVSDDTGDHIRMKHPKVSGISSTLFYTTFFQAFLTPEFLYNYIVYKLTGKSQELKNVVFATDNPTPDAITNDISYQKLEKKIEANPVLFYSNRKKNFNRKIRDAQFTNQQILGVEQVKLLMEIKKILRLKKTSYRIILNPAFTQQTFNKQDLEILQQIFGEEFVFDFTGKNKYTKEITNFYDDSHYRPNIARSILSEIYYKSK